MTLTACEARFGSADISLGEPSIATGSEYIYSPFSHEKPLDRDYGWGIYDIDGNIVEEAAYRRGPELALIGQSDQKSIRLDDMPIEHSRFIYFGPLIPHFGHFITTSLARAWLAASSEFEDAYLLCHSDHRVIDHFNGLMGSLTSILGLPASRFVVPPHDLLFTHLTIPGPAFIERNSAHINFRDPMHRIGDAVLRDTNVTRNNRPVWLSTSRLHKNSSARFENELEVEQVLLDRGFDIACPEYLTATQKIELFSSREHILGFAGSAFHAHVFSRTPPKMTCITLDGHVNSNFYLLDKINEVDVGYYHLDGSIGSRCDAEFAVPRRIDNVGRFVSDVLEAANIPDVKGSGRGFRGKYPMSIQMSSENSNCLPDLAGESYREILKRLHQGLQPKSYLEIGTLNGGTLALADAPSISIDPFFQIQTAVIGQKKLCLFFQMGSDDFFDDYDPKQLLGRRLDLAFLDGMHHCEFLLRDFINAEKHAARHGVIALHDCLPVEIPMTDRTQNGTPPIAPHRGGWWTGDVWRTLYVIKKYRPDLRVLSLDAAPTGLVLISNLNPQSTKLTTQYDEIVDEMLHLDLAEITVSGFLRQMDVQSTRTVESPGALVAALRS